MKNKLKVIVWQAADGWRWHMKRCGRIVAESGESYKRRGTMERTIQHIVDALAGANYQIEDKVCET